MSDDIIARAEAALASVRVSGNTPIGSVPLVRDLVAELKTARAELERVRECAFDDDITYILEQLARWFDDDSCDALAECLSDIRGSLSASKAAEVER